MLPITFGWWGAFLRSVDLAETVVLRELLKQIDLVVIEDGVPAAWGEGDLGVLEECVEVVVLRVDVEGAGNEGVGHGEPFGAEVKIVSFARE